MEIGNNDFTINTELRQYGKVIFCDVDTLKTGTPVFKVSLTLKAGVDHGGYLNRCSISFIIILSRSFQIRHKLVLPSPI